MKKLFLMAMVAIALVACNGNGGVNGSGTPAQDKKALTTVTTDAVNLLGQDLASVEKSLVAAGFKKIENPEVISAPAKKLKAIKADEGDFLSVTYAYNMPENADQMTEEESQKYLKNLLAKGQFVITTAVLYFNDKVAGFETVLIAGVNDNINLTYTDISDKLYSSMPENAIMKRWQGELGVEGGEPKVYEKHEEYVASIAKAKAVGAMEQGNALTSATSMSGLTYICMWERPTEEREATMTQREGYAYTLGSFMVADMSVAMGL